MDQKKFQMYVNPETDPKLYKFIDSIEQSAPNKRGYVVDQIKEILRAWSGLVDIYGEKDVLLLSMRLAAGNPPKTRKKPALEEVKTEEKGGTSLPKGLGGRFANNRFMRE